MFFYEEGECITNIESAMSRPEDFGHPDDGDKVVYFQNGCNRDYLGSINSNFVRKTPEIEPTTQAPVEETTEAEIEAITSGKGSFLKNAF